MTKAKIELKSVHSKTIRLLNSIQDSRNYDSNLKTASHYIRKCYFSLERGDEFDTIHNNLKIVKKRIQYLKDSEIKELVNQFLDSTQESPSDGNLLRTKNLTDIHS